VNNSSPSLFDGGTYNNVNNSGAHGFSEILYGTSRRWAITGPRRRYHGQHSLLQHNHRDRDAGGPVPYDRSALAMAGSLVRKKVVPASAGTLATDTSTFVFLLAAVVLIVGALEYFPRLALARSWTILHMVAGKAVLGVQLLLLVASAACNRSITTGIVVR